MLILSADAVVKHRHSPTWRNTVSVGETLADCCCLSVWLALLYFSSRIFSLYSTSSSSLFFNTFFCLSWYSFNWSTSLSFFFPSLSSPCLTGRHNPRCLVVVLSTCLLHDGRQLACHPSSFAVVLSSDSGPLLSSGLSVWLLYRDTLGQADPSSIQCHWDRGSGLCPRTIPSHSCHYLILLLLYLNTLSPRSLTWGVSNYLCVVVLSV